MAFPLPRGITPPEISFLAEMEMVTILPRQRLEGLELLGVSVSDQGNTPDMLPIFPFAFKVDFHKPLTHM